MPARARAATRTTRAALTAAALVAVAVGAAPPSTAAPTPAPSVPPDVAAGNALAAGRRLVAQDLFSESTLDTNRWVPYDENSSNEVSWSKTDGDQLYGLWEVRARFDAGAGYGPAILLWPRSNVWPRDGEIDLVESVQPNRSTALSSLHWGNPPRGQRESGKLTGDYTQWHVYAVDWQPTYVKMSIDGQTTYDSRYSKQHPTIPSTPMHLVVQQEPGPFGGSNWIVAPNPSTPDDVVEHVDWVKIYK
jgi:endo-1,3-1,4-beta-glycanase ExoK